MFLLMGVARRIEEPFLAMQVELVNDGPVTIWIDSKNRE